METKLALRPANLNTSVIAYAIDAVPIVAGVTRTQVFDAIRANELTARKCGRRTIIEADELRRWSKRMGNCAVRFASCRPNALDGVRRSNRVATAAIIWTIPQTLSQSGNAGDSPDSPPPNAAIIAIYLFGNKSSTCPKESVIAHAVVCR